ncbi:MAG: glycosyltransferase family 2 protein [Chloroflexota bacterium]|nr:glycosyltransferase family 2 protein [Dehalococcoidia bacterium]MDW8254086.1 glycosyltransferase family 2 protein [Chloroflexota bacterium]
MPSVEIVIPVYNEEKALPGSIAQLRAFLIERFSYPWRIVIADNASVDRTPEVGRALAAEHADVHYLRLEQKGRGRALRAAWLASTADILSYMDVDLSTNLNAFPPLIDAIVTRGYDLAIGSRLMPASRTTRSLKREVISRGYNLLIKVLFWNHFSDAQCGFKAITRQAAHELLPLVEDESWFFDTELLLRAEQHGYRIAEVPVEWIEDLDSRVNIIRTAIDDVRGLLRVRFGPAPPLRRS